MRALTIALLALAFSAPGSIAQAQEPAPIQDNSFLIEEAYNQEARVVQHINAFFRSPNNGWWYSFTQEWPMGGQKSQLSYTLPLIDGGFADMLINYRFQAVASDNLAVSPRFSVVLPTGKWEEDRGHGTLGVQVNLPVSVRVNKLLTTHWNAGTAVYPAAPRVGGGSSTLWTFAAGGSAVLMLRPSFNFLVEVAWLRTDDLLGPVAATEELFINPGIRWAHNLSNGLQIVPGIAVPIGVGASRGETAVFLYLSLEHAF